MVTAAMVFAALAALLHVYIFTMESLTWTSPRTRATFGTTAEEAETANCWRSTRVSTTCSWRSWPASASRDMHRAPGRGYRAGVRRRRVDGRGRGRAVRLGAGQGARRAHSGSVPRDRDHIARGGLNSRISVPAQTRVPVRP